MTSPRFVEIPADRLLGMLREIGSAVDERGGLYHERVIGREVVVDVCPPRSPACVRVYTSLAAGASEARDCGEDAVRVIVLGFGSGGVGERPLGPSEKVLRTAPRGASDRVGAFLDRLRRKIREAYAIARRVRACECGSAMAVRTRRSDGARFLSCVSCRRTASIDRERTQERSDAR